MKIDRHLYLVVTVVVLLFLLGLSVHDWLQAGLQFARKVQEDGIGVVLVGYVIYTLLFGSSNDEEDDDEDEDGDIVGRPSPRRRPVVMQPPPVPRGSPLPSQPVNLYVAPIMPGNPRNPSNPSNPR